jgi:hypothetical protein
MRRYRIFTSPSGVGHVSATELTMVGADTPEEALRLARRDFPYAPIVGINDDALSYNPDNEPDDNDDPRSEL